MNINISEKSNFIWKIADILRGDFKQSEYGDVILPFTVLCRLDSVLAPTKDRVMEIHRTGTYKTEYAKLAGFKSITGGLKFYNISEFTFAKFIRLYAFLTHIINLSDENLHKFHAYAKCLLRKLPKGDAERTPDIGSDVMLQYYRVQKVSEGSIALANEDGLLKSKTSGTGLPLEDEKEVLSAIIQSLNERLGTNFTEMDKVLEQFVQDMAGNQEMVLRSKNPLDLFKIIYDNTIMDVVLGRMAKNQEFCEKYLEDEEFRKEVDKILLPLVHERLSKI